MSSALSRHRVVRVVTVAVAVALAVAGCGDDDGDDGAVGLTPTATETPSPEPAATPTAEPEPTPAPEPDCELDDAYTVADEAVADGRLAPGGQWSTGTAAVAFDERTTTGEDFARRLGLDCGVKAAQRTDDGGERLLIAAWTGPRFAYVVQATDEPSTPYSPDATVTFLFEAPRGEFLRDGQLLWGARAEGGETILIGHLDYSLGATAKSWQAGLEDPPDPDPDLESERHAIAVLEASGARNVSLAQPAEFGSEQGYVQFVSPTGQLNVVDVAPQGWFDPLQPRYNSGETRVIDVEGIEVRVTEKGPDDEWAIAGELGFACGDHVWIIQPPFNGTTAEMVEMVRLIAAAGQC